MLSHVWFREGVIGRGDYLPCHLVRPGEEIVRSVGRFPSFLGVIQVERCLLSWLVDTVRTFCLVVGGRVDERVDFSARVVRLFCCSAGRGSNLDVPSGALVSFVETFSRVGDGRATVWGRVFCLFVGEGPFWTINC